MLGFLSSDDRAVIQQTLLLSHYMTNRGHILVEEVLKTKIVKRGTINKEKIKPNRWS